MENQTLLYAVTTEGRREFAEMVYSLQQATVKFEVCQDRGFLQITIISGDQC